MTRPRVTLRVCVREKSVRCETMAAGAEGSCGVACGKVCESFQRARGASCVCGGGQVGRCGESTRGVVLDTAGYNERRVCVGVHGHRERERRHTAVCGASCAWTEASGMESGVAWRGAAHAHTV